MEAGCEGARRLVLLWRERGDCDELRAGFGSFEAHLDSCAACGRRYRSLLPLMRRDASVGAPPAPDAAFVARVMGALPARAPIVPVRARSRALPLLAAAAAVLVAGGLALLARAGMLPRDPGTVAIHFTIDAPDASSVVLVGSFSDWTVDDRFKLRRAGADGWSISVRLKKNELYSYGFLIDGERWTPDPNASETIDDGFGNANSLLRL